MKHFLPLPPHQGESTFTTLSARAGSIQENKLGGWYGYRAAKAGLDIRPANVAADGVRRRGFLVQAVSPQQAQGPI